jgi:dihydroceramide fatty acyl 2-hydroxylase
MTGVSEPGAPPLPRPDTLAASPRLFKNPVLDKLSRVHWTFPLVYLVPIVLLLWESAREFSPAALVACGLLGYAIWTLSEYLVHRYMFHWEFPGAIGANIHFLTHGIHHAHPSDPLRLVMPPLMSAPIVALAWAVISLVFGAPLKFPVMAGFLMGYVIYDELHYHLHNRQPRTRIGAWLRWAHMVHHFRNPERGFGISAPYWDYVFGTAHNRVEKPDASAL